MPVSSSKASSDIEGAWEVWGGEGCLLQGQPCGEHSHSQSWLQAGIHGPAPEKRAHPLSGKSGQQFGLPARSFRSSKFRDSERGPCGSGSWTPDACNTHNFPPSPGSADEQSPLPSRLSSEASSLSFGVASIRTSDFTWQ